MVREHITSYNGWNWVLDFIYDNAGRPFALKYSTDGGSNFTTYYYVLNLQGDVVALLNSSGSVVVRYTYNAWGEPLTVTGGSGNVITDTMDIAHINPLRYRGYYYDTETGFYYLQSRYYDPANHRFINADSAEYSTMSAYSTNDTNLFTYCGNSPVARADDGGQFWNVVAGAVIGAIVGAVTEIVNETIEYVATGDPIDWGDVVIESFSGAVYGGVVAATGSTVAGSVASSATRTIATGVRNGDSFGKIVVNTVVKSSVSYISGVAPKVINKSLSGKYLKLNKFQKIIKKLTDEPHRGKYQAPDSNLKIATKGLDDESRMSVGMQVAKTAMELIWG